MSLKPGFRDVLWMASGAAVLLALVGLVMHFRDEPSASDLVATRARKLELVDQMRVALVSASASEQGAVLGASDAESQRFAEEARAALRELDRAQEELAGVLAKDGVGQESALLEAFSSAFGALRKVDDELLDLATRNTNLKASALSRGPLAEASAALQDALSRLAAGSFPEGAKVTALALGAEVAALRVQAGLPAHIAEPSDDEMDRMEAGMAEQEQEVRRSLEGLRALPGPAASAELPAAEAAWARFLELKAQVLRLSRENTNVRSLALSLDRRRAAMLACQQALDALRQAIREEPVEALSVPRPR